LQKCQCFNAGHLLIAVNDAGKNFLRNNPPSQNRQGLKASRIKEPPLWTLGDVLGPALKGAGLTLQGAIIKKRKGLGDYHPRHAAPRVWLRNRRDRRILPEEKC